MLALISGFLMVILLGIYIFVRIKKHLYSLNILKHLIIQGIIAFIIINAFYLLVPNYFYSKDNNNFIYLILGYSLLPILIKLFILIFIGNKYFDTKDKYDTILYSLFLFLLIGTLNNLWFYLFSYKNNILKPDILEYGSHILSGLFMGYYLEMYYFEKRSGKTYLAKSDLIYSFLIPLLIFSLYKYIILNIQDSLEIYLVFGIFNFIGYYLIYSFIKQIEKKSDEINLETDKLKYVREKYSFKNINKLNGGK